MRKMILLLFVSASLGLVGCEAVQEVSNTVDNVTNAVDYFDKASNYVSFMSDFSNEAPGLIEQALQDENARKELEAKLTELQTQISTFNQLTPPEAVTGLHQEILGFNQSLEENANLYLQNVKDGNLDMEQLQNNDFFKNINEINRLYQDIESFNQ
ncbi:hypothetical protein IC620_01840 [Hazenella sp. IB182357]|uniref:Lipoprotein n=1 Tax=Polycladospora coralii TaxID=2771432 RepID=A0A926RTF5_9BACL|nr:DUF6376 family protein [Polycladospora coralii]MBD1371099.1 hypothetical protein [Polycladospora coralii]MBS7530041.1 hypothetical protein [Polycladospora coralii]